MQKKFWASSSLCLLTGMALICAKPAFADGESTEEITPEVTEDKALETEPTDQDIANVTAEGDFLLPTHIVPDGPKDTVDDIPETPIIPQQTIIRPENPLTESTELEEVTDEPENLPEPTPAALPIEQNTPSIDALVPPTLPEIPTDTPNIDDLLGSSGIENDGTEMTSPVQPKKSLLLPIRGTIAPVKPIEKEETEVKRKKKQVVPPNFADQVLEASHSGKEMSFIMPQDLKLTFYPNATDFSGQTVKWIKAFSVKASRDPRYIIEIRLSLENPILQQQRLFVVQNILMNNGLSAHQLAVTYVDRPENSLVLRTVKKAETTQTTVIKSKTGKKTSNTLISW